MASDVFETVRTDLAVREYKDQSVPEDLVRRIVEAGRLTASSMNGQPWHFVVVQEREHLDQLGRSRPDRTVHLRSGAGDRGRVRVRQSVRGLGC